jgi:hypothetical protein
VDERGAAGKGDFGLAHPEEPGQAAHVVGDPDRVAPGVVVVTAHGLEEAIQ